MSEPKAEDKAAKKLKDRGIGYVMAIEGACAVGAIGRNLNSQVIQLLPDARRRRRKQRWEPHLS